MTMLEARTQLAAKTESAEGTAVTLSAADAMLVSKPKFDGDIAMHERPLVSASLSRFAAVPGARFGAIEFSAELKGSGAAGTPPAIGTLIKACGFAESVVTDTSVTYAMASSAIDTLTMALYMDGMIHKIWGARGSFKLAFKNGEPVWADFRFLGADFSVEDGALLSGVSYEATNPQPFLNAAFALDSYAALIGSMDIDMASRLTLRQDINQASGHKSCAIVGREPVFTIDPEKTTVAGYDWWGKLRSGNEGALTLTLGGTAGNIVTVTAPKAQYAKLTESEKEGIRNLGVDGRLNRDSGDDEISIAFT